MAEGWTGLLFEDGRMNEQRQTPIKGRDLKRFTCWFGCRGKCLGCQLTLDWNLIRQYCHCGAPATGYRSMGRDEDVEFFCDDHFKGVPIPPAPSRTHTGRVGMSRSGYSDDCDNLQLWRNAVNRAILGARGQTFLTRLRVALDAMPVKRLITDEIVNDAGDVCALGAVDPSTMVDPYDRDAVARHFGIAPALAAEIVYINDEAEDGQNETPEQRWIRMRAWVDRQLVHALNHGIVSETTREEIVP